MSSSLVLGVMCLGKETGHTSPSVFLKFIFGQRQHRVSFSRLCNLQVCQTNLPEPLFCIVTLGPKCHRHPTVSLLMGVVLILLCGFKCMVGC